MKLYSPRLFLVFLTFALAASAAAVAEEPSNRPHNLDNNPDGVLEEWKRLRGVSNGGYHYLGAAKIMAPIGKAFAEAMIAANRTSP